MKNLDLDLLRTLVTVEKANTFSGAAQALFKTQSAITQQMQRLESQMGCPLFQKKGRRRILTAQGQQLADYGRRLLAINDEALRSIGRHQIGRATSELQSLMRRSYAVYCLKNKNNTNK